MSDKTVKVIDPFVVEKISVEKMSERAQRDKQASDGDKKMKLMIDTNSFEVSYDSNIGVNTAELFKITAAIIHELYKIVHDRQGEEEAQFYKNALIDTVNDFDYWFSDDFYSYNDDDEDDDLK